MQQSIVEFMLSGLLDDFVLGRHRGTIPNTVMLRNGHLETLLDFLSKEKKVERDTARPPRTAFQGCKYGTRRCFIRPPKKRFYVSSPKRAGNRTLHQRNECWRQPAKDHKTEIACILSGAIFRGLEDTLHMQTVTGVAATAVEIDSTVTRTVFGHVCWTCFQSWFLSQICSVFLSCDISTVTVLIRSSREFRCCFVVWQFVFAQQKNMYLTSFMHFHLILTRGSGSALAAVERVSGLLYLIGTNDDLW